MQNPVIAQQNPQRIFTQVPARLAQSRRRPPELFGVIYVDVDGFKQVNDQLGHPVGDQLLCRIADLLRGCVRSEDLVARLGGDEFTILLTRLASTEEMVQVSRRLPAAVPTLAGPLPVPVGLSMGMALGADHHASAEALLHDADSALYDAKRRGKGRAVFYGEGAVVGG